MDLRSFVNSLPIEGAAADRTIEILEAENVTLKQNLESVVSMEDLEDVGVPKEALAHLASGVKVCSLIKSI